MDDTTNLGGEAAPEVAAAETEDFAAFEAKANAPETVTEAEVEPEGFDTGEDNQDNPDPVADDEADWDTIEYKGKQVKVPKGSALMQADYTRKTQELAEQRKAFETTLTQFQQASTAEKQIEAEYIGIQQALSAYDDIDWRTWIAQDPVAAQQARIDLDDLRAQAQNTANKYQQAQGQRLALTQQEIAKRNAEGLRVLAEKIPDWGGDKAKALVDYGSKTYGFSPQEIQAIDDPRVILALNDAYQFRQLQAKQQQRAKVDAVTAVKPVPVLKGNSGRVGPKPDTNDFKAFEKMAAKVMSAR